MRDTYKNILMWALYAALFLLCTVIQTVIFGKLRLFGVKLAIVPVCLACVAMHTGSENGALFGLVAGIFWMLAGADGGVLYILLFPVCGAVAGYLCDRYLNRRFVSALAMCLLTLLVTQVALFLFRLFLGDLTWAHFPPVFLQIALSMFLSPLLYPLSKLIRKAGA